MIKRKGSPMANSMFKKLAACLALVAASLALSIAPAFADTTYGTVSSGNIKVSVPTKIPMYVDAAGKVMTGDASIKNVGTGDVVISDVNVASTYSDFTLKVSTVSDDSDSDWFSYSNGSFNKSSANMTLAAGEALATKWSVDQLDATKNSDILEAATTGDGAKLATVTYTFEEAPVDFAVFSADDNTLRFYRRISAPQPGSTFDGYTATNVFERIDSKNAPFNSVKSGVMAVDFVDKGIRPMKTSSWFYDMNRLTSIEHLENLDTSRVTNMGYMFYGCSKLASLDVSGFDTSSVTSMSNMFRGCWTLTSLDVSGFDTSRVTNMAYMFYGDTALTSLNVSKFDTSKVADMSSMFETCSRLTSLDVSGFDTSSVTSMSNMFEACSKLTSLNVSNFHTSNVTNMGYMFYGCNKLASLDVSGFDTSSVTNMSNMFRYCLTLTKLNVSNFHTSNVTNMGYMFYGCNKLASLDVSGFDTSSVTNMSNMFYDCGSTYLSVTIGDGWTLSSFPGSSTSTWYGKDGTSYNNSNGIDPAVNKVYYKMNPKAQAAVSEVPVVTEDEAAPADSQLVALVDLSTTTVLDTQQQGETSEPDTTQEPKTSLSGSTTESSQGDAVNEEASLQELPAAA